MTATETDAPKALQDDSAKTPKGSETEDMGEPFKKGGDKDISNGPLVDRGCTDIVCLIVFVVHWVLFFALLFVGFGDGNPSKLYRPRDFRGDYCGLETNWNGGLNLKDHMQRTYTMNVTHSIDFVAKQLVCSSIAENQLTPILTTAELTVYRCACCKDACSSCTGSLGVSDLTSTSALSSTISSKMGEFTGIASATSLFSTSGSNGAFITNVWSEVNSYFNAVCLPKCTSPSSTTVNVNSSRKYTYSPPPDVDWYKAWNVLANHSSVNAAIRNTIATSFTFGALDSTTCPYHARYCVPFPGVTFEEVYADYCTFKMATEILNSIGSSASEAYESLGAKSMVEAGQESFGDAFGDFLQTIDTFFIVCVLAFVIGFVFMVVLRFLVAIAVWTAILLVLILWTAGGAFLYIRSGQCKGAGLFESGQLLAEGAATSITTSSANEAFTGNGADYRGVQVHTRSGKFCQAWSAQSPHQHTTTASTYPNSGLSSNYCRNPEDAPAIWCFTTDPTMRWETCEAIGVIQPGCPMGYEVDSETWRTVLKVLAWICWVFALIWALLVCCKCRAIRLAIAILEAAAKFIYDTKQIVFVPMVQILIAILWVFIWGFIMSFILSQVPEDRVPTGGFATYVDVMGTTETEGQCNNESPAGGAWKYFGDLNSANDACSGNYGDVSGITPACWRCYPPRFILDTRFWFGLFVYLWNAAFLIAVGECVIAGAVATWFFANGKSASVSTALKNCFRYHLGSLAMGSFILAVVQFCKYICEYMAEQAKAQKNKAMQCVWKCIACCLWCVEKCVKYMNRQAYAQVAILGKNFCTSAKNAFFLWLRNMARFGVLAALGGIILGIGYIFIMAATTILGYMILKAMHDDVNVVVPVISYLAISYLVGRLFMNVFGMSIDAMLHCFLAAEELECREKVPEGLQKFLDKESVGKGGS